MEAKVNEIDKGMAEEIAQLERVKQEKIKIA
jgi:hypothetical protein